MRRNGTAAILTLALLAVSSAAAADSARSGELLAKSRSMMMADPAKALELARQAGAAAADTPDDRERSLDRVQARWLEAESLNRIGRPDEARAIASAALSDAVRIASDSKLHADLLATSGSIAKVLGDAGHALQQFQQSYQIHLKLGDKRSQAKLLQYIGSIYFDAGDFERMLKYYADSAELFDDPAIRVSAYNNEADALKELKRYPEALVLYGKALDVARVLGSDGLTTSILTNMASAQFLAGNLSEAERLVERGLASPGHADPEIEPFLWGVRGQIAWSRKDATRAKAYLDKAFAGQDLAQTPSAFREFHEVASKVYANDGNHAVALQHALGWQRLDRQMRDVMASTNSALLGAQFDFASQELKLAKSKQRFNTLAMGGLTGLLAIAILIVLGLIRALRAIRRSRNDAERANVALQSTNEELERAMDAKSRFLATTSHEIRTPLNGILGMAQVLLADRSITPVVRERVKTVNDAGNTMKALVDDILDAAKMETSGVTIEPEPVRMRSLLQETLNLWEGQAAARRNTMKVDLSQCPDLVLCDPRRVRQIAFNLLSNAIKFTEKGEVSLTASKHDGSLTITVRDTGIGIDMTHAESIFLPFQQVDNSTERQYGGSGLGLAISRNLARAMDGDIKVESEPGKGSTFTFSFIVDREEGAGDGQAGQAVVGITPVILLVESNPLGRTVMATALGGDGVRVEQADGLDAARAISPESLSLAVIDLDSLGGWDGVESLLATPAWSACCVTVLLLIKGGIDDEAQARAEALGVARLLSRPMPVPELCAAARDLLARQSPVAADERMVAA